MPNIKSAIKRVKTSNRRNEKNASQKSALRTSIKTYEVALENNDMEAAKTALLNATKRLDKAVTKGLIHKNVASRKKSRLTKKFNALANTANA